jgi:hypothetical protein
MKHTKNIKASRDTFPVVRKGISLHASLEALLFQKMKTSKTDTETLTIQFTRKDAARCRRAAAFCKLSFDEWLKGTIITSMECDEDDMASDRGVGAGRDIPTGRKSSGWEWREALPDPIAQGF